MSTKPRKRSVTRTIRLDSELDHSMQEEARRLGFTLNTLYNQIAIKYMRADRLFAGEKAISIDPVILSSMLRCLGEGEVEGIGAEAGAVHPRDVILSGGSPINIDSVVNLMTRVLSVYGGWFSCVHNEEGGTHVFFIKHNLDPNWSRFLEAYVRSMFSSLLGMRVETKRTDSSVMVQVAKKDKLDAP